jgi:hypothetical protein
LRPINQESQNLLKKQTALTRFLFLAIGESAIDGVNSTIPGTK